VPAILQPEAPHGRALILLGLGALLGIGLAASGALRPSTFNELGPNSIAQVGERSIPTAVYELARDRLAADKRNPMQDDDRRHILRRLVEEELLIQRGEAIGLVASEPSVRKAIAASMIQSIVAQSESEQASEDELRRFYGQSPGYFTPQGTLHVRQIVFAPREGESTEALALRRRQAEDAFDGNLGFDEIQARWGDEPLLPIPDSPLPANKLRQYLGPSLTEAVGALSPGERTGWIESGSGGRVLLLAAAEPAATPAFEDVAEQVEVAYRRNSADRALRNYLDELWKDADIRFAPGAPLP